MRGQHPFVRRPADAAVVVVGLMVVGLGMIAVRDSSVSGFEEGAFSAVNDLPGALYPVLWPFQQLGALAVGPILAIGAALARRFRLAAAVVIATLAKLATERMVKAVVTRERPAKSVGPDVNLRGDVSRSGESFVSGHALLVTAFAGLVSPYLPGRWKIVPWALAAMVLITRVYVGAHNPLDVLCGAGLGVAIAGLLNLAFGVPDDPEPDDRPAEA